MILFRNFTFYRLLITKINHNNSTCQKIEVILATVLLLKHSLVTITQKKQLKKFLL